MGGIYAIDNEKSHKTEKPSSHWRDHREEVSGLAGCSDCCRVLLLPYRRRTPGGRGGDAAARWVGSLGNEIQSVSVIFI